MGSVVKRVFPREFKLSVARQLVSGEKRISQICREHGLCESVVRRWKLQYESSGESAWTENAQPRPRVAVSRNNDIDEAAAMASRVGSGGDGNGFCYVAAILDAFSRRVIGWHISRDIDAVLVLTALEMALRDKNPEPGWIHHSDQGVQYACRGYVAMWSGSRWRAHRSA